MRFNFIGNVYYKMSTAKQQTSFRRERPRMKLNERREALG